MDNSTLCRVLLRFRRQIIWMPVIFAIIPTLGIVALAPPRLWWLIPVYLGGILFITGMLGTARTRIVREIEKRLNKVVEPTGSGYRPPAAGSA